MTAKTVFSQIARALRFVQTLCMVLLLTAGLGFSSALLPIPLMRDMALAAEVAVPNLTPTAAAIANASDRDPRDNRLGDRLDSRPQQQLVPFYPYPPSVWEKFEEVRRNPQLEQLVQQDIENSVVIRKVIQDEVDRTFSHTTTLLNVLLVVLTAIPAVLAVGFWFLRRSVISQVSSETQEQLRQEIEQQLKTRIADELTRRTEAYQADMDALRQEFALQLDQLQALFSDAQQEKDAIIKELSTILPSPMREMDRGPSRSGPSRSKQRSEQAVNKASELHGKVQALTQQLAALQQQHKELSFSADDYVAQAKGLYFEAAYESAIAIADKAIALDPDSGWAWFVKGASLDKLKQTEAAIAAFDRAVGANPDFGEAWAAKGLVLVKLEQYAEALTAYDRAISVKPSFYKAWFGKARLYALQGEAEQAIAALNQAIAIEPERCREAARSDEAFKEMQENSGFQSAVASAAEAG